MHTAALWTFFQVYLAPSASTLHVRAGKASVSADSTPFGWCRALRWLSEKQLHKPGETGSLFNHIRESRCPGAERTNLWGEREWASMSYKKDLEVNGLAETVHLWQRISAYFLHSSLSIFKNLTNGLIFCKHTTASSLWSETMFQQENLFLVCFCSSPTSVFKRLANVLVAAAWDLINQYLGDFLSSLNCFVLVTWGKVSLLCGRNAMRKQRSHQWHGDFWGCLVLGLLRKWWTGWRAGVLLYRINL